MRLSVEVKRQDRQIVYICRGSLVRGQASDYLFHLLTRSCCDNIVVDLAQIRDFDAVGLQTLRLSWVFLNTCHCRLAFQHASPILMEQLRRKYDDLDDESTHFHSLMGTSATSSK